ncbi:NAD(+) diphosphatase [Kushneria phosphatilytica]|uniref:NAD(+) diphosphatase n=1 Tax=Kushneria phosphatilytica TaxID=657387 RepID=A0A1S1P1I4_9GAMM|nr:NAD(+) diphosphatase [Kushneria phosphatilytica]OHV12345.1 NADH pyrophosphatase [Kushneria phosphatilytica]QEL11065.1 NAD(+) diphosphatase [Kushneria phosphatilytica]
MLIRDITRLTDCRHGHLILINEQGIADNGDGGVLQPVTRWPEGAMALGYWYQTPVAVLFVEDETPWPAARDWLSRLDADSFALVSTALQVVRWAHDHRFCGRCGTRMKRRQGEFAMECPECRHRSYPRISPCIITLVTHGRELLLARSPRFPAGRFSTLAGFIEPGESAEEAVKREVFEEVGVMVGRISYFRSQSWPMPHSFMMGYYAEASSRELLIDGVEIEAADWFLPEQLPGLPPSYSISRHLIDNFLHSIAWY